MASTPGSKSPLPAWPGLRMQRGLRLIAIGGFLAGLVGGGACQVAEIVARCRAWDRDVAPFRALGVAVEAREGAGVGRLDTPEDILRIVFHRELGDAEIAALAGRMERFPNLRILVLQGPKVTDAGLAHLQGLKQLQTLVLRDTGVTDAGRAELRRALPGLVQILARSRGESGAEGKSGG
ncbi:MAG TPA: hypothetical protein VKW77_00575 [Acidimicrobiales bacterium]|nr:hypothetical protein [Acidimicrobiales bacterium]